MSFTGTGAENDPYVVNSYADLLSKCAESGKYVQLGADISITAEYPSGDVPMLDIVGSLDGDGYKLTNFFKNSGSENYCVKLESSGSVANVEFVNIDTTKIFLYTPSRPVTNCKFAGKCTSNVIYGADLGSNVTGCAINVDCGSAAPIRIYDSGSLINCNLKIKTSAADFIEYGLGLQADMTLTNCYIEGDMPNYAGIAGNSAYSCYDNSVLDITTTQTFTLNPSWHSASTTIINITHAPNCTASNQVAGVTAENWLNVSYLQGIGFNIVEVE